VAECVFLGRSMVHGCTAFPVRASIAAAMVARNW
jgi:hypothetical protein